ncbi:MAG: DNA recombination protein RmuC [bacterium]|nr:DNA recombination protein RmuC [bacterium]MDZ4284622.1 DNA recombination protein RmuC [Patescibacteria group bacterium]
MSTTLLLVIVAITGFLVASVSAWFYFSTRRREREEREREGGQSFLMLQNQLGEIARTLDGRLSEASRFMQESNREVQTAVRAQFSESAKIIREVTEGLTSLRETNTQVVSFAEQLQSLQDVLQNPKRRGVLGEYYLETVLKNVLPPSVYAMQHRLGADGEGSELIVDAAIFVQGKIIPIDSKFSLENYNRLASERDEAERVRLERQFKQDLKNRIDETSKYIEPSLGTMDFALMFIPSEAIFYDLIINQVGAVKVNTEELIQYAARKHVNIVSPNSFYAFLQVILHGLRQVEIEQNTELIRKRVGELGRHLKSYEDFSLRLGNSLRTTVNHYNAAGKEFGKIDKDILRISGAEAGLSALSIERPEGEGE